MLRPRVAPAAADGAFDALARPRGRLEVAVLLEPGERRRIEIARAADELGHRLRELLQHRLGGLARGHALGVGGELRAACCPSRAGAAPAKRRVISSRQLGKLLGVGGEAPVPAVLQRLAALERRAEVRQRLGRDVERRLLGPAEVALGLLHLLGAERIAVRVPRAGEIGRAVGHHRLDHDERRLRRAPPSPPRSRARCAGTSLPSSTCCTCQP